MLAAPSLLGFIAMGKHHVHKRDDGSVGRTSLPQFPPGTIRTRLILFASGCLSRIAQLDQRTALPDQCLHSAEADVRPPRRKSGFDPTRTSARSGSRTGTLRNAFANRLDVAEDLSPIFSICSVPEISGERPPPNKNSKVYQSKTCSARVGLQAFRSFWYSGPRPTRSACGWCGCTRSLTAILLEILT
jgi:hypothetical protein